MGKALFQAFSRFFELSGSSGSPNPLGSGRLNKAFSERKGGVNEQSFERMI